MSASRDFRRVFATLETWRRWAKRNGLRAPKTRPAAAKAQFDEIVNALNAEFGAKGRLPW